MISIELKFEISRYFIIQAITLPSPRNTTWIFSCWPLNYYYCYIQTHIFYNQFFFYFLKLRYWPRYENRKNTKTLQTKLKKKHRKKIKKSWDKVISILYCFQYNKKNGTLPQFIAHKRLNTLNYFIKIKRKKKKERT